MTMSRVVAILTLVCLSCSSSKPDYETKAQNPEFLHRSMKAITDRIVHDIFSPPVASRIYTYASVAAYEAARYQDSSFRTLAGQLHGLDPFPQPEKNQKYCFTLASTEAMLKVGRTLIFSESDLDVYYNKTMEEFKASGIPDDVFDRSIAFGDK